MFLNFFEVTSVLFDGDMSDLNATYPIGTQATYFCPDGVQKYAVCNANGEWSHEDLSTCELSGPDPYVEQNEPLPTPEGCDHIPANLGYGNTNCGVFKREGVHNQKENY